MNRETNNVAGKVVVITGASSGPGGSQGFKSGPSQRLPASIVFQWFREWDLRGSQPTGFGVLLGPRPRPLTIPPSSNSDLPDTRFRPSESVVYSYNRSSVQLTSGPPAKRQAVVSGNRDSQPRQRRRRRTRYPGSIKGSEGASNHVSTAGQEVDSQSGNDGGGGRQATACVRFR